MGRKSHQMPVKKKEKKERRQSLVLLEKCIVARLKKYHGG